MPITETLMDGGPWTVDLVDDVPRWVLEDIDVRTRLWASIVITPQHIDPADVSQADLLALARYSGVFLGMGADRRSLTGDGLIWWLGENGGDGGYLWVGPDSSYPSPTGTGTIAAGITGLAMAQPNGLTYGTVSASDTMRLKVEAGDTRREMLDTLVHQSSADTCWQLSPAGVLTVNTRTTLWPTMTTPTVLFADQGGRDGNITGLEAGISLDALNGEDVRTRVYVDWQDGINDGVALLSTPSTWRDFAGGDPDVFHHMDWRPKARRPPPERWRRLMRWQIASQVRANTLATRELNERTAVRSEITIEVDEYDPWRFAMSPGNGVYVWDLDTGTRDFANEVYYQGEVIHPQRNRVDQWTTPILEGYGVYLRYWNGSSFTFYDLTNWVEPERGPTKILAGRRERLAPASRRRKLTRRQRRAIRHNARVYAAIAAWVNAQANRPNRRR